MTESAAVRNSKPTVARFVEPSFEVGIFALDDFPAYWYQACMRKENSRAFRPTRKGVEKHTSHVDACISCARANGFSHTWCESLDSSRQHLTCTPHITGLSRISVHLLETPALRCPTPCTDMCAFLVDDATRHVGGDFRFAQHVCTYGACWRAYRRQPIGIQVKNLAYSATSRRTPTRRVLMPARQRWHRYRHLQSRRRYIIHGIATKFALFGTPLLPQTMPSHQPRRYSFRVQKKTKRNTCVHI